MYHGDCSPNEVYYVARTRTVRSALIHIVWFDEYGHESIQLTNNESIRHFYKLNADIKRIIVSFPKNRTVCEWTKIVHLNSQDEKAKNIRSADSQSAQRT